MTTATQSENWRTKYFDSLAQLEQEREKFKAIETALKRLARRLCTASLGQSPSLDEQLRELQKLMRREATSEELEAITPSLTNAIQALDERPTPSSTPAATATSPIRIPLTPAAPPASRSRASELDTDERVRASILLLLDELRRDAELVQQVDALDATLARKLTHDELVDVLSSTIAVVTRRIQHVEQAKLEIEGLLNHMVGKLDEIGKFVAEQTRSQTESHAATQTLNVQLAGEIKAMGESVDKASDLLQLRTQVRTRIDSIDRHLQEFREREAALTYEARARNDQMSARIAELEAEATRLQTQLKDEQRLAMLDALTRIPNRLAYDRWIDDELKRWQRFGQPTCLAVWDVDHFKRVNDTYGHRAGDRVLRAVADCLKARIRGTDFLARYGGEEFVMILTGTTLDDAVRVLDEMRLAITTISFHFRGTPVPITLSSGVTAFRADDSLATVFDRADQALYRAKQAGRNRCETG